MIACTFENGSRASLRHVAVHAIVEKNDSLLLVKRAPHLSEGGKWGLPGGFLDRDETLAEGILRELREETGWEGRVLSLLRINSRPDRPHEDRQNVAIDFVIEPLEKRGEPDAESTDVQWTRSTRCCRSTSRSITWSRSGRISTPAGALSPRRS